jgi:CHASE3 domain sensor protein
VGKYFFSGLISAIGSVLMYIILFYVIFISWDKLKANKDNNNDTSRTLTTALQLRSPLLYQKMNETNV